MHPAPQPASASEVASDVAQRAVLSRDFIVGPARTVPEDAPRRHGLGAGRCSERRAAGIFRRRVPAWGMPDRARGPRGASSEHTSVRRRLGVFGCRIEATCKSRWESSGRGRASIAFSNAGAHVGVALTNIEFPLAPSRPRARSRDAGRSRGALARRKFRPFRASAVPRASTPRLGARERWAWIRATRGSDGYRWMPGRSSIRSSRRHRSIGESTPRVRGCVESRR